jgi:glycosyltransferase involved in cell wall biosynthesis
LMADWPVHVSPNPLNLDVFRPWPKALARDMMGLPEDVPLIGFGAMGGTRDPRKGWDLLLPALGAIAQSGCRAEAVVFGQSRPAKENDLPMPVHYSGHLSDDIALALVYSAVDLVVVPSRQDNLPQTATEPQACGCPVIAFDTGGLPDAVEHGVTGLLAPAFDDRALAQNALSILTNTDLWQRFSAAARERAVRIWDPAALVSRYQEVYQAAIDRR